MAFLDFFKSKPEPEAAKPKPRTGDIGVMSSSIYQGKDFTFYNPDEIMANKGEDVYKRMLKDDQVKAVVSFKQNAIVGRDWYFDVQYDELTGEAEPEQLEIAEVFEAVINNIAGAWSDKLIEILSALQNGFSVCEKIYAPFDYDGKTYWGLSDIKLRPFETFNNGGFVVDRHGNLLEILQSVGGAEDLKIPTDKVIHFTHQPDIDRFYGESDLKAAYREWWSKDIAIKFRNIHLERHAHGFVKASVEGSLTTTQQGDLQDALDNITLNTSIITPNNVEIDTIQPMNTVAYRDAISQCNSAIARSMLVPNLLGLSEQGPHGSRALGDTQFVGFLWVLNAIDNRLCEAINEQIFRQLAQWNFGTDQFPKYRTQPLSDQEQLELAKGWAELISKGAVTKSDSDERYIRKQLGMPEKAESEDDEEVPVEEPALDDWINEQPNPEAVLKEMADKPWLKRCNFAKIERQWINADSNVSSQLADIMALIKHDLIYQVQKIGGDRSWGNVKPNELKEIAIPKKRIADMRKLLRMALSDIFNSAYDVASSELPPKKYRRIGIGMDKTQSERFINSRMMQLASIFGDKIVEAVNHILMNAITYDKSLKDTIAALEKELADMLPETELIIPRGPTPTGKIPDAYIRKVNIPARLEVIARTETGKAINQARMALFSDPALKGFVRAFEYSAILDSRTTDICEHLNGKILRDFSHYAPPNHFQCRSLLVPVTVVDEWNGKESASPRVEPQTGFGFK